MALRTSERVSRRLLPAGVLLGLAAATVATSTLAAEIADAPPSAESAVPVAIRIDADPGLPVEQIRRALPVRLGEPVDAGQLARMRALLEALPNVRETHLDLVPGPRGDELTIRIERHPLVHDVTFEGLFPVFERDALKVIRMRAGDRFDPATLPAEVGRLQDLMAGNGFLGSTCTETSEDVEGDVAIHYACARGRLARMAEVTVTGAKAIPEQEIASSLRPWFFYTSDGLSSRVEALVQRYRDLGYVRAHVRATAGQADEDGNVPVAVVVDEGKKLTVEIEGAIALDEADLREALPFAKEGGYGYFLVEEGADAIRTLYETSGYPKVEVTKERIEQDDSVLVRYRIREGAELDLDTVRFEGNKSILRKDLKDALRSGKNRWLILAPHWETSLLDEDRGAVADYYRSVGFAEVNVEPARMEVTEEGVVAVFAIDEGPVFHLGEVAIEGSRRDIEDVVAENLTLPIGVVYREEDVVSQGEALQRALNALGFLGARVASETKLEPSTGQASVAYRIEPGPLYRVTGIVELGAGDTHPSVIQDAYALEPGALLTPEGLAETQKNLRALEVFDAIQVSPLGLDSPESRDPDREPIDVPVKVQLRERPKIELDLGFGYDTDRGASGSFSLADVNLFDRAKKLALNGTYGERDRGATATLSDPRLWGSVWKGALSSSYQDRDLEAFDEEAIRVAGSFSRPLPWNLTAGLEISYERTDTTNVVSTDPDAPLPGLSRQVIFTPSITHDSRDDLLYPTTGFFASASVGVSTTSILSDDDFVRYDLQLRRYQTLVPGVVGVVSGRFTDVALYGSSTVVPTPELLFTGGTSTVRGFEEDRVGPLDDRNKPLGGGTRIVANAELRFPLFWLLEGAAFVDAGDVVRDHASLALDSFQIGTGGGLRVRSPVGPLRLDLGYPVVNEAAPRAFRLHFSFGYPF